ncbi:hypothetical protein Clacol_009800 [Clathrus columnatus]|uniref:DNA-directed RNA polymerase III subunit RPC9 n=1 Tax=Clathrus columnatus TaxID=1419009 RepID=A0AAV5AP22_9AGAM|nr:hypothetical protein Clacol_009800 [Clathrus columnatus]
MEVINPRAALLSNFEVLTLLRELEQEQLAETRAALTLKKETTKISQNGSDSNTFVPNQPPVPEVCENLRTVEFEAIAHLTAPFQPTARQSAAGITKLTRSLRKYSLTKAEKLQIVNLAPVEPVQLYVIVEELEDRLSSQMDEILGLVQDSLAEVPDGEGLEDAEGIPDIEDQDQEFVPEVTEDLDLEYKEETGWNEDGLLDEFVDDEGGFEGDLEADEDNE